ncbi:DUF2207 domain-containing protein [Nonomuraea sp. NPDC049695]|uniref:DUF2207 domain-containing protein n=1 Tax=Nonomuraea sp. NPDC049695 TaxID=3154734 RepID=UPI003433D940
MRRMLIALGLGLVLAPVPAAAAAPSYTLPRTVITATVNRDGTVKVVEDHTFRFSAAGHGAYVDIPRLGGAEVESVAVGEGKARYRAEGTPELNVERPGETFAEGDCTDGPHRVVWYFSAEPGSTHTFRLAYTLKSAVTAYKKHAFLHLPLWGSGWKGELGQLRVSVRLPRAAKGGHEQYRAYGRSDSGFKPALSKDRRTVTGTARDVAAGHPVSLDLAFPTAQLTDVTPQKGTGAARLAKLEKSVPEAATTSECVLEGSVVEEDHGLPESFADTGSPSTGSTGWTGILFVLILIIAVVSLLARAGRAGGWSSGTSRPRSYHRHTYHSHTWSSGSDSSSSSSSYDFGGSSSSDSGSSGSSDSGSSGSSSSDGGGGAW